MVEHQLRAQRAAYTARFGADSEYIVEVDGVALGVAWIHRSSTEIRLAEVAVLPAARGRGIATRLLEQLQEEAGAASLPVRLTVAVGNPARALYERLGFVVTGATELDVSMEWVVDSRRRE